jgi:hypothetical protein
MIVRSKVSVVVLAALLAAPAIAQQIIYPAKGQSAKQQQKDEAECYVWAKEKTGYDPAATPAVAAPPQQPVGRERARGAVRGALGGAAIGAIAGDTGESAAINATVGIITDGAKQRQKQTANQQTAAQQQQAAAQQKQQFQRAYGACFEGRGYTVK